MRGRDRYELSRLNSFLACSRAKNKNFSIYLLKPLHRQKMKENFFVVKSSGPLLGRLPLLKHVRTRICYFSSPSVCSWEEIEKKKFSKVGLYICIFADFSSFLMSLTLYLFPWSSLQVYFNQASQPSTSVLKALRYLSLDLTLSRSSLKLTKNILIVQIKTTFFVCSKTDQLFQKPKNQFIVASSFYIETGSLINIWSFIAQPCRCWKKLQLF